MIHLWLKLQQFLYQFVLRPISSTNSWRAWSQNPVAVYDTPSCWDMHRSKNLFTQSPALAWFCKLGFVAGIFYWCACTWLRILTRSYMQGRCPEHKGATNAYFERQGEGKCLMTTATDRSLSNGSLKTDAIATRRKRLYRRIKLIFRRLEEARRHCGVVRARIPWSSGRQKDSFQNPFVEAWRAFYFGKLRRTT